MASEAKMTDRRNPYVLLGVDFGASADDARRGFVSAIRKVRRNSDSPYTEEDITWALHQVERIQLNPEELVHSFRVPANPALFEGDESPGLFRPAPQPIPRLTPALSDEDVAQITIAALRETIEWSLKQAVAEPLPVPYQTLGDNQ